MNCTNHPDTEAQEVCALCGKPFCRACLVEIKDRSYCKADFQSTLAEARLSADAWAAGGSPDARESRDAGGAPRPAKSKTVALVLCLLGFLGLGGLHRMYVGKVGSGVLYVLTGGLCLIGTILDLAAILSGGFRDAGGQPLAA